MPVHWRVVVRQVRQFAIRALEHVLVLSGMSTVYRPRQPHSVPATRAFGIKDFAVHSNALLLLHRTIEELARVFRGIIHQGFVESAQASREYREHASFAARCVRSVHRNTTLAGEPRSSEAKGFD
jgi:hypothetical protein